MRNLKPEPKKAPNGKSANKNASSSSRQSILVRCFFFLAVVGNFVALHRSISTGNYNSRLISLLNETESFLPPVSKPNQKPTVAQKNNGRRGRRHSKPKPKASKKMKVAIKSKPFKVTHFLSHIPKTGVEYAAQDLARLVFATLPLPRDEDVFSITRAQQLYNQSLQQRPDYNGEDPEWLYFHKNSRNHDHENPNSTAYAPPMVCNNGAATYNYWNPFHLALKNTMKFRCIMVIAESHGEQEDQIPNIYTIVREPLSHVVSQYFHCVDSRHHPNGELIMPPIGEWLNIYTNLSDSLPLETRPPYIKKWRGIKKAIDLKLKYNCYNPIDSESDFVQFPARGKDGRRLVLPKDYRYPYPLDKALPRNEETKKIDQQLFDDLKNRFKIIGDTSRMIKSLCSIFIHMTNGEHIPAPCDCTHWDEAKKQQHSSTPIFSVLNLYQKNATLKQNSIWWTLRPTLTLGYDPKKHAHGVRVRGSAFARDSLSPSQKIQITEHLRPLDVVLYNISRAVFDEQTSELEKAHGIKICDDSFNREGEIILDE